MNYLSKIGSNAKKAFNKLQKCDHKNIKKVLNTYNKKILKNKNLYQIYIIINCIF